MSLDAALIAAHARGDTAALVGLYTTAAKAAPSEDAACFYLTQAWVFALDCGDPAAEGLCARLRALGRA